MRFQSKSLENAMYQRVVTGSRPNLVDTTVYLPRDDTELLHWFVHCNLKGNTGKQYGVIVGPTGTGKTSMIRSMCNKFLNGMLYCEVTEAKKFMRELAVSLNMKISPSNITDLILGYFSTTYTLF